MGNLQNSGKKTQANNKMLIIAAIIGILVLGIFIFKPFSSSGKEGALAAGNDLVIPKSEISGTAKFYPYKVGSTNMEVVAVKAGDGTIRTALNTCQVCYDSGKGYYKQQGDALICQNCGNRFKMDQVEKIKGGCNPVPITKENKTDDGTNIIISNAFLAQNKDLFGKWKK